MILKVASPQPIYDHHKHDPYKSKDGLYKKKATSFACVLENIIKPQPTGSKRTC